MRKQARFGTAVAVLGLVLTGCSGDDRDSQSASGDEEFVVDGTYVQAISADPGSLNPLMTTLSVTEGFNLWTYDTLLAPSPGGGFVSNIATTWEVEPQRVSFELNSDVTCDNGEKLTATDVAANFEWIKDEANQSPRIGAQIPHRDFTIEADDAAGTFAISVAEPYGLLLEGIATVPIVCPEGLADPDSLNQTSVGTGPFVLEDSVPGSEYTLTRRDGYTWGPDGTSTDEPGVPKTVIIRVVADNTTAANQLLAGEVNEAVIGTADRDRVDAAGLFSVQHATNSGVLVFNRNEGHPGSDPAVRKALDLSIDKEEIRSVHSAGQGEQPLRLAVNDPSACVFDSVSDSAVGYDADQAVQILEEAGWVLGADGIRERDGQRLELTFIDPGTSPAVTAATELLIEQWRERIGADVTSKPVNNNAFVDYIFSGDDWDTTWFGSNHTLPSIFIKRFSGPHNSEGGLNYARVDNPAYLELAQQALVTPGEEGCELWKQAEQELFRASDLMMITMSFSSRFANGATFNDLAQPSSVRLVN